MSNFTFQGGLWPPLSTPTNPYSLTTWQIATTHKPHNQQTSDRYAKNYKNAAFCAITCLALVYFLCCIQVSKIKFSWIWNPIFCPITMIVAHVNTASQFFNNSWCQRAWMVTLQIRNAFTYNLQVSMEFCVSQRQGSTQYYDVMPYFKRQVLLYSFYNFEFLTWRIFIKSGNNVNKFSQRIIQMVVQWRD